MSDLGGDNRMQATPVEIYANVRNKALEEAAAVADMAAKDQYHFGDQRAGDVIANVEQMILALKTGAE